MFQEFMGAILEWAAMTGFIGVVTLTIYVGYKLVGYVQKKT